MTLVAALLGWAAAGALCAASLVLRRRLELVADAEHELRGPVAALALAAEAAGSTAGVLCHLDRLRLGLADLTAARRGRRAGPAPVRLPLDELLGQVAAGWEPAARRAGCHLRLVQPPGGLLVDADPSRLRQALGNVLANAVEHGGSEIELRALPSAGGVRVEVCDRHGPDARPAPSAVPAPGRGRGLRIAQAAAEDCGGVLSVRPQEGGTDSVFELPPPAA